MKKVLGGKLYDTETARRIGTWDSGVPEGDAAFVEESLYRKKTGEYFLHGRGSAYTIYGKWRGNTGSEGQEIRPYTPADAMEWAEEHLDGADYIAEFGEPAEDDSRVVLALSVSTRTRARLEAARQSSGVSMSRIVDDIVERWHAADGGGAQE
jgi:hypothetical protein